MTSSKHNALDHLSLGQNTDYPQRFDTSLLDTVPRQLNRDELHINSDNLPFTGIDIWTAYELSWLAPSGLPHVAIGEFEIPCDSNHLIESKSLKLYLNGYNQTIFASMLAVQQQIQHDLSNLLGCSVKIRLFTLEEFTQLRPIRSMRGDCLEQLPEVHQRLAQRSVEYKLNPELLQHATSEHLPVGEYSVHSHLLKSNCLITNQPDWGSVEISYTGKPIQAEALLCYILSFRSHNEFHEQCVERIFCDIMRFCQPQQLSVYARYTRRGGLDINPHRYSYSYSQFSSNTVCRIEPYRLVRQ